MSSRLGPPQDLTAPVLAWPRRRWLAFVLLVPGWGGMLLSVSHPALLGSGPAWWVLLVVVVVAGAGTLASYVPATGVRPEVGCTPCAGMSVFTVVAAVMLLRGAGADLTGVALAAAVSMFGVAQRLGQPRACATSGEPDA